MAKYSKTNYNTISNIFNCEDDDPTCKANMNKIKDTIKNNADFQYFFSQKCGVPPEKTIDIVPKNVQKPKICENWETYKSKGGDRSYVPPTAAIPEKPLVIKSTKPKIPQSKTAIPEKPLVIKSTQPKITTIPISFPVQTLPVQPSKLPMHPLTVQSSKLPMQPLTVQKSSVQLSSKLPYIQSLPVQPSKLPMQSLTVQQSSKLPYIQSSVPLSSRPFGENNEDFEFDINFLKTIQLNTTDKKIKEKFEKIIKKFAKKIEKKNISDISFSVPMSSVKSSSSSIQKQPVPFVSQSQDYPVPVYESELEEVEVEKMGEANRFSGGAQPDRFSGAESESEESDASEAEKVEEGESEAEEEEENESEEEEESENEEDEASEDLINELNENKTILKKKLKEIYPNRQNLIDDIANVFNINKIDNKSIYNIREKIYLCNSFIEYLNQGDSDILAYVNYIRLLDKQNELFQKNKKYITEILEKYIHIPTIDSNMENEQLKGLENGLGHLSGILYDILKKNNFFLDGEYIEIKDSKEYKELVEINKYTEAKRLDIENRAQEYKDREAQRLAIQQLDTRQPETQGVKKSRQVSVENIEDIIQDINMEEDGDEIKKDILKCLNV